MDPASCSEHEMRKVKINRESVVLVLFDIEKAYDMLWKDKILIKLRKLLFSIVINTFFSFC